ncbi:MAG: DUF4869 domain-containing protein [Lachnospiraceae bacterium]|nr:DUF4869 domain-containing protein [Lachnospiraceae bacterium]
MLSIYFGKVKNAYYGPSWFKANFEPVWMADPFVTEMIRDIDRSEYKGGNLIESEVLGPISPRELSGGVQTLICIFKRPDLVFDATSCGQNCARWLLEIGRREDVKVMLEYYISFGDLAPFEIQIANTGVVVDKDPDYTYAALDLLNMEGEDEG